MVASLCPKWQVEGCLIPSPRPDRIFLNLFLWEALSEWQKIFFDLAGLRSDISPSVPFEEPRSIQWVMYNGAVAGFATPSQLFGRNKYVRSAYYAGMFLDNSSWNVINKLWTAIWRTKRGKVAAERSSLCVRHAPPALLVESVAASLLGVSIFPSALPLVNPLLAGTL